MDAYMAAQVPPIAGEEVQVFRFDVSEAIGDWAISTIPWDSPPPGPVTGSRAVNYTYNPAIGPPIARSLNVNWRVSVVVTPQHYIRVLDIW
jgi:hypothetical protein